MTDPSTIAKVVWITFSNQGDDGRPPLAEVSLCLSDKWRYGLTFRIIVYLDYIEDHTSAPLDDFITTADTVPYEPITTILPSNLGAVDDTPESKGASSYLPQPQQGGQSQEEDDSNLEERQPRR